MHGSEIRSVVFLTGLSPQSLLLSVCAFLLRFGFSTLLIFTLYNNPAAPESDKAACGAHGRSIDGTISQAAGMQSWIRDLIDLKTQISVLQNCMHAASQQPCTASQPLQGCRQCEPWTAAAGPIDPATAWPNGLLRQRAGYLRLLPHPVSRPGSSQIDRSSGPRKYTFMYIIVPESWL